MGESWPRNCVRVPRHPFARLGAAVPGIERGQRHDPFDEVAELLRRCSGTLPASCGTGPDVRGLRSDTSIVARIEAMGVRSSWEMSPTACFSRANAPRSESSVLLKPAQNRHQFVAQLIAFDRQVKVLFGHAADGVGEFADGGEPAGDDEPAAEHECGEGTQPDQPQNWCADARVAYSFPANLGEFLLAVSFLLAQSSLEFGVRPRVVDDNAEDQIGTSPASFSRERCFGAEGPERKNGATVDRRPSPLDAPGLCREPQHRRGCTRHRSYSDRASRDRAAGRCRVSGSEPRPPCARVAGIVHDQVELIEAG